MTGIGTAKQDVYVTARQDYAEIKLEANNIINLYISFVYIVVIYKRIILLSFNFYPSK